MALSYGEQNVWDKARTFVCCLDLEMRFFCGLWSLNVAGCFLHIMH
jgi:hypothetical protein